MPILEGYKSEGRYIDMLGCHRAALRYLGADVSYPWIYGATGIAFAVNINAAVDCSGPTNWDWQQTFPLCRNLGYTVDGIMIRQIEAGDDFPRLQREAWDLLRESIDEGIPVYGWEVVPWIPCHGIITGYEGDDYLYSACGQQGRSSWTTLGNCDVKVVEVRRIMRCEPAPLLKTVYDSLNFALRMAEEPSDIVNPGYRTGSAAFALWADSLEAGTAERESQSFNAKCWLECRTEAVSFLNEAKVALPGMADSAFDATSHYYSAVCAALTAHLVLFPPSDGAADWNARLQSHESAILLREAAEAEACAISALHDIVTSISVL